MSTFTLFPKLPFELRSKVWKLAAAPRLVHITRTAGLKHIDMIPAVHQTSRESRAETNYVFPSGDGFKGPLIDFDKDILFIREWNGILCPEFAIVLLDAPALFRRVQKMAVIFCNCDHCNLANLTIAGIEEGLPQIHPFAVLEHFCPKLNELIFLFRAGPLGATVEDLYEVRDTSTLYLSHGVNGGGITPNEIMKNIKGKRGSRWRANLKLTFARNEKWAR